MTISNEMTDSAIVTELGVRLARLRLDRNLTQTELAAQAGVSKRTVERAEAGGSTQLANFVRLCRALEITGRFDLLLPMPVESPVAQLKRHGKRRQRVRHRVSEPLPGKWTWNDKTAP